MAEESTDCLQCRLTSGGGLLGSGAYVIYQSKKVKTPSSRTLITAIGYGISFLGILRIFALPPFKSRQTVDKTDDINKGDESGYIIGKFPPKLH